jgi:hypothetical protein
MGFGLTELVVVIVFLVGGIFVIGMSADTATQAVQPGSQEEHMIDRSVGLFSGFFSVGGFIILIFGIVFLFAAAKALGSKGGYR